MWIFTRYGFFSVSAQGGNMVIRGRCRQHLLNLLDRFKLSQERIIKTDDADYRYRILIMKEAWPGMMEILAREQDWSNFKDEADAYGELTTTEDKDQKHLHLVYIRALHDVWDRMYSFQRTAESIETPVKKQRRRYPLLTKS